MPGGFTQVEIHRFSMHIHTHMRVFPKDNDTNKMAYIFQYKKTKIADAQSECDVL